AGYGCGRIAFLHSFSQSRRLFPAAGITQKFIYVDQTRPGENSFIAHMTEPFRQILQQLDLEFVPGSEIGVPAFAGKNVMAVPVPEQASLAEAGSGRHYSLISALRPEALIQRDQIRISERC